MYSTICTWLIARKQSQATERTEQRFHQLLEYVLTQPDTAIQYYVSGMVLNIHLDASYLSETLAQSWPAGYYFGRCTPKRKDIVLVKRHPDPVRYVHE